MAKMLKSRHTGVTFGYDPTMAANTNDYEVIDDKPPAKKRRRRTAKPKAKTVVDTPPTQTELDLDVDGLLNELDDS